MMRYPRHYDTKNYCQSCKKFFEGKSRKLCPECGEFLRYKRRVNPKAEDNEDYVRY